MRVTTEQEIQQLRSDINQLLKSRALLIHDVIKELDKVFEKDLVVASMKTALYNQGKAKACQYQEQQDTVDVSPLAAAIDLKESGPDFGRQFPIQYSYDANKSCTIQVMSCPIKEAMKSITATEEDFATLIDVLDSFTAGYFEGLGMQLKTILPTLEGGMCCNLHISK